MKKTLKRHLNCFYRTRYKLVLAIKNTRIESNISKRIKEVFCYLLERWGGELIAFINKKSYIIVDFSIPPHMHITRVVNNLKTVSSRRVRKELNLMDFNWVESYMISTIGIDDKRDIRDYINYIESKMYF